MRETPRRVQLALEWSDAIHWNDLSTAARMEIRALLRELLRHAVSGADEAEAAADE